MKIISIEGNIGSGKSTLIELLKSSNLNYVFIPEPVNLWNEIKDHDGTTILERYYQDPERYAFSFQMMAYITRIQTIRQAIKNNPENSIFIIERSVYTDREVFAKMLYHSKKINFIEYSIYLKWFDELSNIDLDAIIYVHTKPETCFSRIKQRNRQGENEIALSYLENCGIYHETWINNFNVSKLVIDGEPPQTESIIKKIQLFVENNLKK
jgi:deoxyadenosine/deoxycytidine kinase